MGHHKPPSVPYVQAAFVGEKQRRPTAIVLALSMTTSDRGAALGYATNLHRPSAPQKSFHYMLDEAETYRGVWDNRSAHGIHHKALGVLICAEPAENVLIWEHPTHFPVMDRTAKLVAQLCLAYKIKPRYLTSADEARWKKWRTRRRGGFIVRVPGEWASSAFLILVKTHMIKKES